VVGEFGTDVIHTVGTQDRCARREPT
jgi:hypothetical protein